MESTQQNLSPEEKRIAREEARTLLRDCPWLKRKGYDEDDLYLEALVKWCMVRARYTRSRGASWETFMKRVIRNHFADLVESENARMRGGRSVPLSLDAPLFDDPSETLKDLIRDLEAENDIHARLDAEERNAALDRALAKLTSVEQELCLLLAQDISIAQISRSTGRCRSTVYEAIARIKTIFEDEGLKEYLP